MNVILATHDSPFARYLASSLVRAGAVDKVVVEKRRAPVGFYARKLRRIGPVDGAFQIWLNRWFAREGRRHLPATAMPCHERVLDVNGCSFGERDFVIGFGTSRILPETLARMPHGFLNLHTGLLPEYRGVKSEFWAMYNGDVDRIGWTLHFMNARLDRGDVVMRRPVRWRGENPAQMRAALVRDAALVLATLLQKVRTTGSAAFTRQPQGEGRYYSGPRYSDWRTYRRRAETLMRNGFGPRIR